MRGAFITIVTISTLLFSFSPSTKVDAGIQERPAPEATKIRDIYVIHFVIDGLNKKVFDDALTGGRLPAIKKYFSANGASFQHAVSNFPSTSATVYQSFVTGLMPGHAGIPHLERFDRQRQKVIGYLTVSGHTKINDDLINLRALTNPAVAEIAPPTTIFELLNGYPTAAIYSSFHRGASYVFPKGAPIAALWSTYISKNEGHVDVLAMRRVMELFEGDLAKIPRYTLVGLYSTDILGHGYGPESDEVKNVLVQFDLFFKGFITLLERRGILDKTYILVSADHGMHESGELFDLDSHLKNAGLSTKPGNPKIRDYTIYTTTRGVVSSHIYVRHDGGFAPITNPDTLRRVPNAGGGTTDLVSLILGLDATDLLIVRAGGQRARIFDRSGRWADAACYDVMDNNYCSFQFDRAVGDPLGFSENPGLKKFLDGRPHPSRNWLVATAHEKYPDAVVALSQIFHDGRAGDAFITMRDRFGFRKAKAGNHGGVTSEDMRIPLLIGGPSVPSGEYGVARPADIYPLLLEWFGLDVPTGNYDGVNPFIEIVNEDTSRQKIASLEHVMDDNPPLHKMVGVEDFIRTKIYPIAKPSEFKRLATFAREESGRRNLIVKKLRALLNALKLQRLGTNTPRITDPEYLDDHIEIVARTKKWAEEVLLRMEDITKILERRL